MQEFCRSPHPPRLLLNSPLVHPATPRTCGSESMGGHKVQGCAFWTEGAFGAEGARLISATVAAAAFTRSPGASSISRPRRPALQNTVANLSAEASSTTG